MPGGYRLFRWCSWPLSGEVGVKLFFRVSGSKVGHYALLLLALFFGIALLASSVLAGRLTDTSAGLTDQSTGLQPTMQDGAEAGAQAALALMIQPGRIAVSCEPSPCHPTYNLRNDEIWAVVTPLT